LLRRAIAARHVRQHPALAQQGVRVAVGHGQGVQQRGREGGEGGQPPGHVRAGLGHRIEQGAREDSRVGGVAVVGQAVQALEPGQALGDPVEFLDHRLAQAPGRVAHRDLLLHLVVRHEREGGHGEALGLRERVVAGLELGVEALAHMGGDARVQGRGGGLHERDRLLQRAPLVPVGGGGELLLQRLEDGGGVGDQGRGEIGGQPVANLRHDRLVGRGRVARAHGTTVIGRSTLRV
jgi:hypothetical protein